MDTKIRVLKNPVSYLRIPEVPYPHHIRIVSPYRASCRAHRPRDKTMKIAGARSKSAARAAATANAAAAQFWNATPHTFSSLVQTCRKLLTQKAPQWWKFQRLETGRVASARCVGASVGSPRRRSSFTQRAVLPMEKLTIFCRSSSGQGSSPGAFFFSCICFWPKAVVGK